MKNTIDQMTSCPQDPGVESGCCSAPETPPQRCPHPSCLTEIYILRHGTTVWNKEHRIQGHTDIPLDPVGVEMALQTGLTLQKAGIRFDRIYASPLSRAYETAVLAGRDPSAVVKDPRIRELSFGRQEGCIVEKMIHTDVPFRFFKSDPAEYDRRAALDPTMESLTELLDRTAAFLREEIESAAGAGTAEKCPPAGTPAADQTGTAQRPQETPAEDRAGTAHPARKTQTGAPSGKATQMQKAPAVSGAVTAEQMQELPAGGCPRRILISGHGAVNKGLLMHIRGEKDLAEFWGKGLQPNCGIDIVLYDPMTNRYRILEENRLFYPEELLERSGRLL